MKSVENDSLIFSFSATQEPALRAAAGDEIQFHTRDALNGAIRGPEDDLSGVDFRKVNPATGPVFVEGAEPGDTLAIEIQEINPVGHSFIITLPGLGILGDRVKDGSSRYVRLEDGYGLFSDDIRLPLRPMIGVIGVAPAKGEIPNNTPGDHGGNLDTNPVTAGSTVYLPVYVEGALLALGDVHALMGDGEMCIAGLECDAIVKVKLGLVKGQTIPGPRIMQGSRFMTLASHEDLKQAVVMAAERMIDYLMEKKELSWTEAYMLTSIAADARISQVVDPLMTVRVEIDCEVLGIEP
jgi:amidase